MKKIILSTAAVLTLAACEDPFNREGVGFTGIDGEPRTISEVPGAVAFAPPATNVPAELADIPPVNLVTDAVEPEQLAKIAIKNGGRSGENAVQLVGSDTNLFLSTVNVNGTLYAVLRTPRSSTRVDQSVGRDFGDQIEQFTGCLPAGAVFSQGRRRSPGFAMPVNCS